MKVFAFKIIIAALIVAGSDGTGGRLSPYSPSDKVTTKLVKQFWAASNKNRPGFLEPQPSGATNTVVLAWIKSGETSQPIQTLAGTDSSGKKRQVSIAVLSHLRLVSIESDRRTLLAEVELFPDITPDDLIKKQPTYRQLWADYRKTIQLRIEA